MTAACTDGILRWCAMPGNSFPTLYADDGPDVAEVKHAGGRAEANAARLALCWNTLVGFDDDVVNELRKYLEGMSSDQLRDLIADG